MQLFCIIVGDTSTIDAVEDYDEDEDSFNGDMQLGDDITQKYSYWLPLCKNQEVLKNVFCLLVVGVRCSLDRRDRNKIEECIPFLTGPLLN